MANLTFPSNPTNGQKVTVNDKVFVYNSTTSRWTATKLNVFGNLTGDFTIAPPELSLSNNSIAFSTTGETVYITYTVDQDVKASIANNGLADSSYANVTLHQTNNTIEITAGSVAFAYANVVLTVTNTRTSNTAWINLSASYTDWTATTQQAKIQASDPEANDRFGSSVAISGDTVIVGAPLEDTGADNAGAAYIFTRDGSTWTQQAKIQSSDIEEGDRFGYSVAIDGDTVIVGAHYEDTGGSAAGSAYIFTRSGSTWTQQAKIQASDVGSNDNFGQDVAIDGDTVIVGAYREDTGGSDAGSAYIFTRDGSTWTQQAKIQSSDAEASDNFGYSVAIDGDTVIVSAYREDTGGSNAGSAYIFTRSGSTWTQQQKIQASDIEASDDFGQSVAIEGDTVIVSARFEDTGGTNAGSAYIFTRSGSTWTQQAKIQSSDIQAGDFFGQSVAINGGTVIVGAFLEDTGASDAGSAYIFTRSGSTWTQQAKIQSSDAEASDNFGSSVAIEGDTVIVGAYLEDTNGSGAGAVYIFTAG